MSLNLFLVISSVFIEWFEFAAYLSLTSVLAENFLEPSNQDRSIKIMYIIFALSYLARPIAAIIYGRIADKKGRRESLIFSLFCISLATFCIGILPGYNSIGIFAPILLTIFRVMQSFAVAAQFNNATNFLIEHLKGNRIIASCLISITITSAMSFASFVVSNMNLTYWRSIFIISALGSFIIYLARTNIKETPEFLEVLKNKNLANEPLTEILNYKARLIIIGIFASFIGVMLYAGQIYFTTDFLIFAGKMDRSESLKILSYMQLGLTLLIPALAYLGQRMKIYYEMSLAGIMLLIIVSPLMFYYGSVQYNYQTLIYCISIYVLGDALFSASVFFYIYALLPTKIRCTGSGIAYSISIAVFGGISPILSKFTVEQGYFYGPGIYISLIGFLTLFAVYNANLIIKNVHKNH